MPQHGEYRVTPRRCSCLKRWMERNTPVPAATGGAAAPASTAPVAIAASQPGNAAPVPAPGLANRPAPLSVGGASDGLPSPQASWRVGLCLDALTVQSSFASSVYQHSMDVFLACCVLTSCFTLLRFRTIYLRHPHLHPRYATHALSWLICTCV